MNHADRQRLRLILKYIDDNESDLLTSGVALMLNEARAIVDNPEPSTVHLKFNSERFMPSDSEMAAAMKVAFLNATETGKIEILNQPIHEFEATPKPRRRHRALSPIRLVVALTIAAICLIALTASTTPLPGPSHQPDPNKTGKPSPRPAQHGFQPVGPTLTAPSPR